LASILDNQQLILTRIQQLERPVKLERTCPKCSRQYDGDMHSCPHCGYRD
jgi:rRNA maturation endonuclease Nob1